MADELVASTIVAVSVGTNGPTYKGDGVLMGTLEGAGVSSVVAVGEVAIGDSSIVFSVVGSLVDGAVVGGGVSVFTLGSSVGRGVSLGV